MSTGDGLAPIVFSLLVTLILLASTSASLTGDQDVNGRFLFGPNYLGGKFNTTVAFTVPLFAFRVPSLARISLGSLDTAAILSLGFLVILTLAVVFVLPFLGYGSGRTGRQDLDDDAYTTDYVTDLVYSALAEIRSVAGDTCTQSTVCEVWRNPYRFGYLAAPLRLLYPPDGYPGPRQAAALFGLTSPDTACRDQYPCDLSLMDVIEYLSSFISVEAPIF